MARNSETMTKQKIIKRINDLVTCNGGKYGKYQRNYCIYNQSPNTDLNGRNPRIVGYLDDVVSESSVVPKINVVKSVIDSVVAKIATAHCRPFVNTVKGSFKTIQVCKQLQIFFDFFFDEKKLQQKVVEALRDACIFDTGYLMIVEATGDIIKLDPWNVYTRQTERENFRSVYIKFPNRSVDSLSETERKLLTKDEAENLYVDLSLFIDCNTKTRAILINKDIRLIDKLQSDTMPVIPIYYTMPITGNSCLSIVDVLKGIQSEIDLLMKRISDASVLNPALTYFVANASNIKVGQLNNRVGNIIQYNSPSGTSPVEVSTPNFIGSQYMTLLESLVSKAYELIGISQLSAQGKKTVGLNSGVALATQEDIETSRFQVVVDQYIDMFNSVAKTIVKLYKSNADIIEPSRYSLTLKWKDVEKEYDRLRIQFSCADSLSKDPSEKLKQLQTLAQAGIIPASQIASLLELPDINRGYNVANNSFNTVNALIDACIYDDKYDVPDYVPFVLLKEQIINMMLNLRSASVDGSNDKDIGKLEKYYALVEEHEEELQSGAEESMQNIQQNSDATLTNKYRTAPLDDSKTEENLDMEKTNLANPYDASTPVEPNN